MDSSLLLPQTQFCRIGARLVKRSCGAGRFYIMFQINIWNEEPILDYQALVNCCSVASAILSVEMTPEGRCGDIRIVCANQPYREFMGSAYHDGMLYQELVPQDQKFEDFCFRAAHKNQRMHAYVEAKAFVLQQPS